MAEAKKIKKVVVDGKQFKIKNTFVGGGTVVEVPEDHPSQNLRLPFVGELEGDKPKKAAPKKRNAQQ